MCSTVARQQNQSHKHEYQRLNGPISGGSFQELSCYILLTQSTHFLMDSLGDFQWKPIILQFYFVGLIRRLRICSLLCQGDLTILNIYKMLEGSMKCCKTSSLRECTREIWLNLIWLSPVNKMLAAKSSHILALELQGRHQSPIFTLWKSWLKPSTNLRWTKPYQTWHSTTVKYGKTTTGTPWLMELLYSTVWFCCCFRQAAIKRSAIPRLWTAASQEKKPPYSRRISMRIKNWQSLRKQTRSIRIHTNRSCAADLCTKCIVFVFCTFCCCCISYHSFQLNQPLEPFTSK